MTEFKEILAVWFQQYKRILPWREVNNPYFVWVSEIILQQTRVDTGTDYFLRFVERFPDVDTLANANENDVLKLWQGLGYYSRARNIHAAARQIKSEFNGTFPDTYEKIRSLKGIGDYTAAAIASISYGLPYAVIDGNVYRVLSRIFGIKTPIDTSIGKKEFQELANQLLDHKNPAIFNEAIMEFGALQCVPRNPGCNDCPFQDQCLAFARNEVSVIPVKSKQTKVKERYLNFLFVRQDDFFYIEKRSANDIWRNLYQFPLIETATVVTLDELLTDNLFSSAFENNEIVVGSMGPEIVHLLTHQRLHVRFVEVHIVNHRKDLEWIRIHPDEIPDFPVPKIIENFINGMYPKQTLGENKL